MNPGEDREAANKDAIIAMRVYLPITMTPIGELLTIGGELHPFDEGSWTLHEENKKILNEFLNWMADPQVYKVRIRGFTAGNLEDSLVRVGDPGSRLGQRVVRFSNIRLEPAERLKRADHWLLASLRVAVIRDYLIRGFEGKKISPDRIEVQIDAYNEPVADNMIESERYKNRRVEIVIQGR